MAVPPRATPQPDARSKGSGASASRQRCNKSAWRASRPDATPRSGSGRSSSDAFNRCAAKFACSAASASSDHASAASNSGSRASPRPPPAAASACAKARAGGLDLVQGLAQRRVVEGDGELRDARLGVSIIEVLLPCFIEARGSPPRRVQDRDEYFRELRSVVTTRRPGGRQIRGNE